MTKRTARILGFPSGKIQGGRETLPPSNRRRIAAPPDPLLAALETIAKTSPAKAHLLRCQIFAAAEGIKLGYCIA